MTSVFVEGDLTIPCDPANIWDRWMVVVIPTEQAWADNWSEVARAVREVVGPRAEQMLARVPYQGDRPAFRVSDFWGCTSRPPTEQEARTCFQTLIDAGLVDVVLADCADPIPDPEPDPLPAPTGVTVTDVTDTTAVASWTPVDGADGYSVELKRGTTSVSTQDVTAATLALDSLTPGTGYSVTVTAKRGAETAAADPVGFTTTGTPPAARTARTSKTSTATSATGTADK